MKTPKFILLLIFSVVLSCHSASENKAITTDLVNDPSAEIEMLEDSYYFGEIQQGESSINYKRGAIFFNLFFVVEQITI